MACVKGRSMVHRLRVWQSVAWQGMLVESTHCPFVAWQCGLAPPPPPRGCPPPPRGREKGGGGGGGVDGVGGGRGV